jgi:hypothetical protein
MHRSSGLTCDTSHPRGLVSGRETLPTLPSHFSLPLPDCAPPTPTPSLIARSSSLFVRKAQRSIVKISIPEKSGPTVSHFVEHRANRDQNVPSLQPLTNFSSLFPCPAHDGSILDDGSLTSAAHETTAKLPSDRHFCSSSNGSWKPNGGPETRNDLVIASLAHIQSTIFFPFLRRQSLRAPYAISDRNCYPYNNHHSVK